MSATLRPFTRPIANSHMVPQSLQRARQDAPSVEIDETDEHAPAAAEGGGFLSGAADTVLNTAGSVVGSLNEWDVAAMGVGFVPGPIGWVGPTLLAFPANRIRLQRMLQEAINEDETLAEYAPTPEAFEETLANYRNLADKFAESVGRQGAGLGGSIIGSKALGGVGNFIGTMGSDMAYCYGTGIDDGERDVLIPLIRECLARGQTLEEAMGAIEDLLEDGVPVEELRQELFPQQPQSQQPQQQPRFVMQNEPEGQNADFSNGLAPQANARTPFRAPEPDFALSA